MAKINQPESFDVATVTLKDSNLIEASAGTGKTYSIAILVLRLLLEKKIAINEILMVTFTKAAVAELEERIRLFVRSAYKVSLGESIKDETITRLVHTAIEADDEGTVQQLLKAATLFLDETSVLTIHSFCQQTLTGFAFETNQLFGAETLQDTSSVVADEVNRFWRENITSIPAELLRPMLNEGLSRNSISSVVKEHINGKKYIAYDQEAAYSFSPDDYKKMLEEIRNLEIKQQELQHCLIEHISKNKQQIIDSSKSNAYVSKNFLPLIDTPEDFITQVWNKRDTVNVKKVFETTLLPQMQACEVAFQERNKQVQQVLTQINCFAINKITAGINDYKQRNNLLSFDDMIVNLHAALVQRESKSLVAALRAKYKAVFIDEFQDTDKLQYEIFEKAFGEETILFYIGDPKQSIYAWRKADIFTYFKASEQVRHRYNMNQNFRSSKAFIESMNAFFLPADEFDTFYFREAENAIRYIPVESPAKNTKGELLINNEPDVPISILKLRNKDEISNAVANQVADLFTEGKYIIAKNGHRKILTPADIGILVRTNTEGQTIKNALADKGIPAVTINDTKVLQSAEAEYLLYFLQAINNATPANISKALLSPFTGYTVQHILQLDDEQTIELFRKYKTLWDEDGIYAALMQLSADYNVRSVLLANNTESGERVITNFYQLTELVHKVQNEKHFSPAELIGLLQRGIEGMETEGDQYEQRIESDEEAVKIVTIHKSKGLEYNIVFAPYVDFLAERKLAVIYSFRHPETGEYVSVEKHNLSEQYKQWTEEQAEQENRRLLYVAITRAVYKCFIFKNEYYKSSTISTFINALQSADPALISFTDPPADNIAYAKKEHWQPPVVREPIAFNLHQSNWNRMSYTMLAAKGETTLKPRTGAGADKYDQFIFNQLTRGAKTGNMLHYLLEHLDFSANNSWTYHIAQAIKRFAPRHEKEYSPMLMRLLEHITQANISIAGNSFKLSEVSITNRLNELEFDFNVPLFSPSVLQTLRTEDASIAVKYFEQSEGIMNGKVDMFFEHGGKYYILDWKSNYLGDEVKYYEPHLLQTAMNESNYHLQYFIYTVAVKKYLQSRLPSFNYEKQFGGVIYMFIRGVRESRNTGIFTARPSAEQIQTLEKMISVI